MVRHCAGSILTDSRGRALLLWQPRLKFGLPGGVVEAAETPVQAAVREAKEEVGVDISPEYLIGMYYLYGGGKPERISFVFKSSIVSGEPFVADPSEVLRLEWVTPGTVPTPIVNDGRAALPDFWAGRRGVVRTVERLQDF